MRKTTKILIQDNHFRVETWTRASTVRSRIYNKPTAMFYNTSTLINDWIVCMGWEHGRRLLNISELLRSASEILYADNFKNSKRRRRQQNRQGTNGVELFFLYCMFTRFCHSRVPRLCLVKTKLTTYNSTSSTTCQNYTCGKRYGELYIRNKHLYIYVCVCVCVCVRACVCVYLKLKCSLTPWSRSSYK
jgi:hypothetical protein